MSSAVTHSWLCEHIVDEASLAIVFADREGLIRLWNAGAEALFGWSAAEATGQSMDLIVPEKHRPRHWEGYDRVMKTGVTKYGREALAVPALRKDGSRVSIEFFIVLLHDGKGEVLGSAALISDVSARWERDKATKAKMAALESKVQELEKASVTIK